MCDNTRTNPQHPYTKRLLSSEPKGIANPRQGSPETLLEERDIRVTYTLRRGGAFRGSLYDLQATDGLSLNLKCGETPGLVGESGSGKTTFGQALLRLNKLSGGEVDFLGNRIDSLNRAGMKPYRQRMQVVFQDPFSSLNPRMSVWQLIEEGLIVNGIGKTRAERIDRVKTALRDAGLPDTILSRFPHEFSGGQRQRIAIALEPEFILLDEPTSALDLSIKPKSLNCFVTFSATVACLTCLSATI